MTGNPVFKFQLIHDIEGTFNITEPIGWKDSKLVLERDQEYSSLIERFEGAFSFYGKGGRFDGGINIIKYIENIYGIDADLIVRIEISFDDGETFQEVFNGLYDFSETEENNKNQIQSAIISSEFWTKFINRAETQVDLQSTTGLDGSTVDVITPINLLMTSQAIEARMLSTQKEGFNTCLTYDAGFTDPSFQQDIPVNSFAQINLDDSEIDELTFNHNIIFATVASEDDVAELMTTEYAGQYAIDIKISMTVFRYNGSFTPNDQDVIYIDFSHTAFTYGMTLFIKIGDETPIALTRTDQSYTFVVAIPFAATQTNQWSEFTYSDTRFIAAGTTIKLYMQNTGSVAYGYGNNTFDLLIQNPFILGTTNSGLMQPIIESLYPGDLLDGQTQDLRKEFAIPPGGIESHISIIGQTIFPETNAQAFFIHDSARSIIDRITDKNNSLTATDLGNTLTHPAYGSAACDSRFVNIRGLQIRQYSLSDKPFQMSWKQWWAGAHPIFNLGLGYTLGGQIEIGKREDFFSSDVSVQFDWVEDIIRRYDNDVIFNKVDIGYQKWQSEDVSGIDDPQTKHSYATRFKKVGKPLSILSDWIAASLAIEKTRRETQKKSKDYKYDDETFIVSLSTVTDVTYNDVVPEKDENFTYITGLLNSETRYNSRLTPARNLIRWISFLSGCLQDYTSSFFKFVSGEGNYDMDSDLADGDCDDFSEAVSEKQDIPVSTDRIHLPDVFEIKAPLYWEEYLTIRNNRKKAIGISQTASDHTLFYIKQLDYDICHSKATIIAWPKTKFNITIPDFVFPSMACNPVEQECIDAVTREIEDGDYRLTEDGQCREIE
jgi:hypothetical protein